MKKIIKLFSQTTLIVSLFVLAACGGGTESDGTNDKIISGKLLPPESDNIYFGAMTNFGNLEDNVQTAKIEEFDWLAKKDIAWAYFSNNWNEFDKGGNYIPEIRYPAYSINQVVNAGKTPFIRLTPWVTPRKLAYSTAARKSKAIDLVTICRDTLVFPYKESRFVTKTELQEYIDKGASEGLCFNNFSHQNIIDKDWDKQLRQWARDYLEDPLAKDDEGNPIPLLMTYGVEMNGYWFPWGGIHHGGAVTTEYGDPTKADGPERYVDAYKHIIDIFREEGADQYITWFFAPDPITADQNWMTFLNEDWNAIKNYYPGDDYIDWVGFTQYGPAHSTRNWVTFSEEMDKIFEQVAAITSDKPIALLETGAMDPNADSLTFEQKITLENNMGSHTKSEWFEDFFDTILNSPLNIKAFTYWNDSWELGEYQMDLRINSSEESLTTFQQLISNPRFISELRFSE